MPKYAPVKDLSDYTKLNIGRIKEYLKPNQRGISITYTRNGNQYEQYIGITTTPCNYGGVRYWFTCPGCQRRVGVLYRNGIFVCRHCIGVGYHSQLQSEQSRQFAKLNALRERLGWHGGIVFGYGSKPKGMHTPTFNRLFAEYVELERVVSVGLSATYATLTEKLETMYQRRVGGSN